MTTYYDPWTHAIQIFFTRIFQFILLTLIFGFAIWYSMLHHQFNSNFYTDTKLAIYGDSEVIKSLFYMCFVSSALITAWLFTWLIIRKPQVKNQHARGARLED